MRAPSLKSLALSERDLDFVVREAAPEFEDKGKLKEAIREDEDFRKALVGSEKVFKRVMEDREIFLSISPALYFEILIRKALKELDKVGHTVERVGSHKIPIFDAKEVIGLLARQPVPYYLADMLSSFTRIESYTFAVRLGKGIWRRIRFNDMDVDSLIRVCGSVDEEYRFGFYKRIADVCLFISGIFPEYAQSDHRYPLSGKARPEVAGRMRRSIEEYEEEGRRFYKLAWEHPSAKALELSEVFWLLHEHFNTAKKPLNFISEHYLHYKRHGLFGLEAR